MNEFSFNYGSGELCLRYEGSLDRALSNWLYSPSMGPDGYPLRNAFARSNLGTKMGGLNPNLPIKQVSQIKELQLAILRHLLVEDAELAVKICGRHRDRTEVEKMRKLTGVLKERGDGKLVTDFIEKCEGLSVVRGVVGCNGRVISGHKTTPDESYLNND